jgi:hypothetical protein
MPGNSFYDLDHIIAKNEQRLEQYGSAYEKLMERLTNIIVIFSAMAIFLIPIVREVFWGGEKSWVLNGCFVLFVVLFGISVVNTVRLLLPVHLAMLRMPEKYYIEEKVSYENFTKNKNTVDALLKASYIRELQVALLVNLNILQRKILFHARALNYALLSIIPFLICFGWCLANHVDELNQHFTI